MSTTGNGAQPDGAAGRSLDRARRELMLTHDQLWISYFGLGGTAQPGGLVAYLEGSAQLTRDQHNVVVHALNEEFAELGQGYPVPYFELPS